MPATRGVHHIAIQVADLPRAERFYCGVLGLAVLRRWPAAEADAGRAAERSLWLDTGGDAFLALERVTSDPAARADIEGRPGLHLVALRIPRAERAAWEARLEASGAPIYHRTEFTLYVRDPEGNRVGLSHYGE